MFDDSVSAYEQVPLDLFLFKLFEEINYFPFTGFLNRIEGTRLQSAGDAKESLSRSYLKLLGMTEYFILWVCIISFLVFDWEPRIIFLEFNTFRQGNSIDKSFITSKKCVIQFVLLIKIVKMRSSKKELPQPSFEQLLNIAKKMLSNIEHFTQNLSKEKILANQSLQPLNFTVKNASIDSLGELYQKIGVNVNKFQSKTCLFIENLNEQLKMSEQNLSRMQTQIASVNQSKLEEQGLQQKQYQTIEIQTQAPIIDRPVRPFGTPRPQNRSVSVNQIGPNRGISVPKRPNNGRKTIGNNIHQNDKVDINREKIMKEIPSDIQELIIKNIKINFGDIVGLKDVKVVLDQAIIRPRLRPDLYQGITAPPRGLLLYGPPGNGKTFICKALAKQSGCTFFSLSAASIMSKWLGDPQKMIRKIFQAAEKLAPSIIFIDQIDSMLTARSQKEHDAMRRLKTQFFVLMDGITSPKSGEIIVIGATNLPKELDSAAKRRFAKFVYIGHPDEESRKELIKRNLKDQIVGWNGQEMKRLVQQLQGFSASEIKNIMGEVCNQPLQQISMSRFEKITKEQIRKVCIRDFEIVVAGRKPIVSKEELAQYKDKI